MTPTVSNEQLMQQLLEMERLAQARHDELMEALKKVLAGEVEKPNFYEQIVRKVRGDESKP